MERFIASLRELVPVFEDTGSCLAIEGWPGPGAVASTPESYRAVLDGCESATIGINYDPSHLIATGIDPVRFAHEFAGHVRHAHGKDTEISAEAQYQYGIRQPPLTQRAPFGDNHWRYTIPGHGEMRWTAALEALQAAGYGGGISIELEDKHFNGSEAGEKAGLKGRRRIPGLGLTADIRTRSRRRVQRGSRRRQRWAISPARVSVPPSQVYAVDAQSGT